jgi:SAM-dependent methyltransferase
MDVKKKDLESISSSEPYDQSFYNSIEADSISSAKEIVPFVLDLIKPASVIDVGCGTGAWLSVFQELGIEDILGIDGGYVDKNSLRIAQNKFRAHDLTRPLKIERKFDLVVSLEVAEHISSRYAKKFIESLTSLGSVVMFSAAIPYQGGTNHINEQWQDYWEKIFYKNGFEAIDYVRKLVWDNPKVGPWFAQNMIIYVQKDYLEKNILLKKEKEKTNYPLSIVHPKHYENLILLNNVGIKQTLKALPKVIFKAVINKMKKM